jgi:non-heme chloroperoxidase
MADRAEVILVHGAANSGTVWRFWQQELAAVGWRSHAIDLRGHGGGAPAELSVTSMRDYADDVAAWANRLSPRPIVIGWSMGGLVAMMVAADGLASACVGLAPSAPAPTEDETVPLRSGVFGSEEYGIATSDPANQPAMPDLDAEERAVALGSRGLESRLARDERKRGVVLDQLRCPLLIVTGEMEPDRQPTHYQDLDLDLPAEYLNVASSSHWGLVLNRRTLVWTVPAVSRWMARAVSA